MAKAGYRNAELPYEPLRSAENMSYPASGFRVAGAGNFQKYRVKACLWTTPCIRMVLRGAAALFTGQYVIQDQVDAIFAALVVHRVQSPVVDLIQLPLPHIDRLITYRKPDIVVRNDRQMDAM